MELCVILQVKVKSMKKILLLSLCAVFLLSGCSKEFNRVLKSTDYDYKYEYAKECFVNGKYNRAVLILQDLVTMLKGSENGQECLYMLAMSSYCAKDYETAAQYFQKYYQSYPKGTFAEMASFYVGQSLYMSTPEPRLDQTPTMSAIAAFQEYLDMFPGAQLKDAAHDRLYELQDKLVDKELYSAKLYYDLGSYFGNCTSGGSNYEACIITAQNAIRDFPYSHKRDISRLFENTHHADPAVELLGVACRRHAGHIIDQHDRHKHKNRNEQHVEICRKRAEHACENCLNEFFQIDSSLSVIKLLGSNHPEQDPAYKYCYLYWKSSECLHPRL